MNSQGVKQEKEVVWKSIWDLIPGRLYEVSSVTGRDTMYGWKMLVQLNYEIQIFLPKRLLFPEDTPPPSLGKLQEAVREKRLSLVYFGGNCHDFEFIECKKNKKQ